MVEPCALSDGEILSQLEALVVDCLQVVSYKWLSWKFSIPANRAKRLLQHFANEKNEDVQVVYAVSGWTDLQQCNYSVQLVSRSKLEEAKQCLVASTSCHVYSLQPTLPKDSADLWSTDFVQATEFFNQPLETNNCLRDNRLSGISNKCVTRTTSDRHPRIVPAAPVPAVPLQANKNVPSVEPVKAEIKHAHVYGQQPVQKPAPARRLPGAGAASTIAAHSESATNGKASAAKPPNVSSKPTIAAVATGKRKTTGAAGQGGSLANLWGRAKPKDIAAVPEKAVLQQPSAVPGDAEAQLQALEVPNDGSSDDDAEDFAHVRGRVKRRQRHVIMQDDSSDDDDDQGGTVSLSSPGAPPRAPESTVVAAEGDELSAKQELVEEPGSPGRHQEGEEASLESEAKAVPDEKSNSPQETTSKEETNRAESPGDVECGQSSTGSKMETDGETCKPVKDASTRKVDIKKRRLVKKTIDERGREVYEATPEHPAKKPATSATKQLSAESESVLKSRPNPGSGPAKLQQKAQSAASTSGQQQKPNTKLTSKNGGKGDGKVPQQGNLFSFFKRK